MDWLALVTTANKQNVALEYVFQRNLILNPIIIESGCVFTFCLN